MAETISELALLATTLECPLQFNNDDHARKVDRYVQDAIATSPLLGTVDMTVDLERERSIHISLPQDYPQIHPKVSIRSELSRQELGELNRAVDQYLSSCPTGEPLLSGLIDLVNDHFLNACTVPISVPNLVSKKVPFDAELRHRRILFVAHHLLALSKRKDIQELSRTLDIFVISRRGYPGLIAAEGASDNIQNFVTEVKSWRWASITLRYDESLNLPTGTSWKDCAVLSETFVETDDLSIFARALEIDSSWKDAMIH